MTTYTTTGSVRGDCGHQHKTLRAAVACLMRDQRGCKAQGGYSDRTVTYGDGKPLSDEDHEIACAISYGGK